VCLVNNFKTRLFLYDNCENRALIGSVSATRGKVCNFFPYDEIVAISLVSGVQGKKVANFNLNVKGDMTSKELL